MRFKETGPDIPDELIEHVLARRAVFLCGAGISFRVGLPNFQGLTDKIYVALGETHDPAEDDAYERREYDRVLKALEKRLVRIGDRSRVRDECAAALGPPRRSPLSDHKALLTLSRDKNDRPRILTTNFDTLFERAAHQSNLAVSSHAVKALPKAGGLADHGILHLHGRIADKRLRLPETDLILTSADFGDAYLRDGWASQYLEDRLRTGSLVLLGYRADDTAVRLLFETLDVDRERFPDLHKIYALEVEAPHSKAIWKTKGIDAVEASTHDVLYETIREWARYAANPHDYTTARVAEILAKDPSKASDFEREQLTFLLAHDDTASLLATNNPSLAWLPILSDLKLVGRDQPWLVAWLERNLENPAAVKVVVANIALLGRKVGDVLDFRLNHLKAPLDEPFTTAWKLIVRHLKDPRRETIGGLGSGWFELEPRLARGERTPEVLELLADLLLPRIKVSSQFTLHDSDEQQTAETVRDLMSVDFETDENLNIDDILRHWPEDLPSSEDSRLVSRLTEGLGPILDDANDLSLEVQGAFSATDSDVPSVEHSSQNSYRHGFLPVVRVMAELWTRLAHKDARAAVEFVDRWSSSQHKLLRRLALYAAANPVIAPALVVEVLRQLPDEEFFFSNTTVELFRLLKARWNDLPVDARRDIEQRFIDGPSAEEFRDGVDAAKTIDRIRYESLGNLKRWGFKLSLRAEATFAGIQKRYPQWQQRPAEQAGFHIWTGPVRDVEAGNAEGLETIENARIIEAVRQRDNNSRFGEGNSWSPFVNSYPNRALDVLTLEGDAGRWEQGLWRPLLWSPASNKEPGFAGKLAAQLLGWPEASFEEMAGPVASWLDSAPALELGNEFWRLWDRVLAHLPAEEDTNDPARYFDQSINSAVGNLAETLIKKTSTSETDPAFAEFIRPRLDALFALPGHNGVLAKVRLAADVAFFFGRAPEWTTEHLSPVFWWDQPLALAAWSARRYANTVGSPALLEATKIPFLDLFGRADVPTKLKEDYADWLLVPLFSNQAHGTGYPLTMVEARTALRHVGPGALWQIGHRFALEMEAASGDEKLKVWREIVGPVFRGTWPLDADLQTPRANFKLVQLLRAAGPAFPEAVDDVLPFIVPESGPPQSTVFSLRDAAPELYELAPRKLLELIDALAGAADAGSVYGLKRVLDRLREADPTVVGSPKYQRLLLVASPSA